MTKEEIVDGLEIYTVGRLKKSRVYITVEELQNYIDGIKSLEQEPILDKIKAEIMDCLKALDDIEKSGFNIYLPNEMSGRRVTYQQCIGFIDKYKAESEG